MPRIVYYISSHGFGHATRAVETINHLPMEFEVEAVTAAPRWLLEKSSSRPCDIYAMHHDSGIIQPDSFRQDLHATLDEWIRLLNAYPAMAQDEAERILQTGARLIVGDISPFAIAVARAARLPVIIVANFSWDWIFSVFVEQEPRFREIIEQIADLYRQTDLLLRTPLHGDLSVFPRIKDIPIIARRSKLTVEEARDRLGVCASDKVVLASFGGFGFDGIQPETLAKYPEWIFLTFRETLLGPPNVKLLDPQDTHHPDAVQAADVALAKLGYGIVTECIAHQTPIIHPPRHDFPEHEVLRTEAARWVPVHSLDEEAFYRGDWAVLRNGWVEKARMEAKSQMAASTQGGKEAAGIMAEWACRKLVVSG